MKRIRYATIDGVPVAEVTTLDESGKIISVSNRLSEAPIFSKAETRVIGVNEFGQEIHEIIDAGGELLSGSLDPSEAPLADSVELITNEKDFVDASRAYEDRIRKEKEEKEEKSNPSNED